MLAAVLTCAGVLWADPPQPPAPRFRTDRVLAKPKAALRAERMAAVAQAHARLGTRVHRQFDRFGGLQVVRLPRGARVEAIIQQLRDTGLFEYVEPDYEVRLLAMPNDPRFADGSLWGLHNTGQNGGTADADIDAPEAWDVRTDADSVIVGVLDTGIDYTHPDLAANLWTNPCVNCPVNGIVYTNDVHGINAITGTGNVLDDHYHGTHVAGTIGAVGNNGIGVVGVAWRVKLMALKFLDSNGTGSTSDAIECLNYAVAKGAKVINNSWGGGGYSQALADAIGAARAAGVIFVAAAGNDGENMDDIPTYPASYTNDNVVAVAATGRNDRQTTFSNYGYNSVALLAPGLEIWSTFPTYTTTAMATNNYPTSYHSINGTSMAAPHVAGAFALLRAHFPTDTYRQLIDRMLGNVDFIERLADSARTGGRLNLHRALTQPPGPIPRFRIEPWREAVLNPLRFTGGSPPLAITTSNDSLGAVSYSWNLGDGSPLRTNFVVSHVFSNAGTYQVTLTATGTNGQTRTASRQVVVDQNYTMLTNVPFAWISDAGHTTLSLTDESWVTNNLPFPFVFYGQTNTTIFIASNGLLSFTTNGLPSWNGYPPALTPPNGFICVDCLDLDPTHSGGAVRVGTVGTAPNRIFVVTWNNVKSSGFNARFTFQALLYEGSHDIQFQYLDVAPTGDPMVARGNSSVVGVEHPTGYIARLYRDASTGPLLDNGAAIRFTRRAISVAGTQFTVLAGNTNDVIDPGETIGEWIALTNEVNRLATGVSSLLTSPSTNVSIIAASAAYPNLAPFVTATNTTLFTYKVGRGAQPGEWLPFDVITTVAGSGEVFTNRFWRRVGRSGSTVTNFIDSADLNRPIPEYPGILISTNVVTLPGHIIEDVNVSLRASHEYASQLKFTIRNPAGAELVLADGAWTPSTATNYGIGVCGMGEIRTVFDSESTNYFGNSLPPYAHSIRPQYSTLTIYNGQSPHGIWTLKVEDRWAPFTGTLNCWGLQLVTRNTNFVAEVFHGCESNTAPVAISMTVTGVANVTLPITLAGSDADSDPLSFLTNSPPAQGTLSAFNPTTGSLLYIPAPGYVGTDSFTFSVTDGCVTSVPATVTIFIEPNSTNFWSGAISGDWGVPGNWLNGTVPLPGSAVLFPNAVTHVVSSSVDRVVSDIIFESTNAYTFASGYRITVTGSMAQRGSGTVTINGPVSFQGPVTLSGTGSGEVTFNGSLTGSNIITVTGGNWTPNTDNSSTLVAGTKWILAGGRLNIGNWNRLGYSPATVVGDYLTFNGGTLRASAALGNLGNRGITVGLGGGHLDANGLNPALTFNVANTLLGSGRLTLRNGGRVDIASAQTNFVGTLKLGNGTGTGNALTAVRFTAGSQTFVGQFEFDDPAANGPTDVSNFNSAPSAVTLGGAIRFVGQVGRQPHFLMARFNGGLLHIGSNAVLSGNSPGDAAWFGFRAGGDATVTNQMIVAGTIQDGTGNANVAYTDGAGNWVSYRVTGNNSYTGGGALSTAASFGNQLGTHLQQGTVYFAHPNALGANHAGNPITIFRATGGQGSRWVGLLADVPGPTTLSNQQPIFVRPINSVINVFTLGGNQPFETAYHNLVVVTNASGSVPSDMSCGLALQLHQVAGGTTIFHNGLTAAGWTPSVMRVAVLEKTGGGTVVLRNVTSSFKGTPVVRAGTLVLEADAPASGDTGVLGDPTLADFGFRDTIQLGGYRTPTGLGTVRIATVAGLGGAYNPTGGANGIGQITGLSNGGTAFDNTTLSVNDLVLVIAEGNSQSNSAAPANGLYRVTSTTGTVTLDREANVVPGSWVVVSNITGKVHAGKRFYLANQNLTFQNGGSTGTVQLWLEDEPGSGATLNPKLVVAAGRTCGRAVAVNASPFIQSATLAGSGTGTSTFAGTISLGRDVTLEAGAGNTTVFSGAITGAQAVMVSGTGTVTLNAANTFAGGLIVNSGATLSGTGSVVAATLINGTLAPGASTGTFTIQNDLSFGAGGHYALELGPTGHDAAMATGAVNLSGVLTVTLRDGFTPTNGQVFNILSAGSLAGTFQNAPTNGSWIAVNGGGYVQVHYTAGQVTLTYSTTGPVTDPYAAWAAHYGLSGGDAAGGADPDFDGLINTNEFLIGFNPTNNLAALRIINIVRSGNDIVITYLGASGDGTLSPGPKTNVLEMTTGTASGAFSNNFVGIATNILSGGNGLGTVVTVTNINDAVSTSRYYRVRVLLSP
ncbi:MAG: S8 family serine peptidase [Verrucomicrobiae bacterium]|nr:S8 family serine peptidase [Verrucomicrobiae bacterium]